MSMFKHLIKKSLLREHNKETAETLFRLYGEYELYTHLIAAFVPAGVYAFMNLPFVIVAIGEQIEEPTTATMVGFFIYGVTAFVIMLMLNTLFREEWTAIAKVFAKRVCIHKFALRGQAVSKADFEKIKAEEPTLYRVINLGRCQGYCYHTCFLLCQTLGKGRLEMLAIKKYDHDSEEPDPDDKDPEHAYTMHTLFVNNGWAFDTTSVRQFSLAGAHEIYGERICRRFEFAEIAGMSYEDFVVKYRDEVNEWARENDCTCTFGQLAPD